MRIMQKVLKLIRKQREVVEVGKSKTVKVVVLSTEVGKFGSVIELPDDEQLAKLVSEGKVEVKE